ncbi:Predicted membrane protein [uncultured Clostridium sp.]|nr:Predicted membrane protein [uncultured Clostridium sp.]
MNIKILGMVSRMTKGEFLYNLRSNLAMLPKEEIENIIEDYSMHINELLDEGESLEQILNKLGDPKEIAKQYIEELGYEDKFKEESNAEPQYRVNENNYKAKNVKSGNVALFIFMQIVNFLFLAWLVFGIGVAVFSVGVSGVAVAGSSLVILFLNTSVNIGIRLLKTFVMAGIGILLFNAAFAIAIAMIKLMIKYVKWNISLIS